MKSTYPLYVPMCNVLVLSLQGCLGLIYTVHIDNLSFPLEGLVSNLFTFQVPVAGGSQVSLHWGEACQSTRVGKKSRCCSPVFNGATGQGQMSKIVMSVLSDCEAVIVSGGSMLQILKWFMLSEGSQSRQSCSDGARDCCPATGSHFCLKDICHVFHHFAWSKIPLSRLGHQRL